MSDPATRDELFSCTLAVLVLVAAHGFLVISLAKSLEQRLQPILTFLEMFS